MQAVILAAGRGTRMTSALQGRPKCLAAFDETALITYQLAALERVGIGEVCVVLGHRAEAVLPLVWNRCHIVYNRRFTETNSLYSLHLAASWVTTSFVLLNGDVLAHPAIFERLVGTPGSAVAYDSSSGTDQEHMKVSFAAGGRLRAIGKSLSLAESHGESTGILKFAGSDTDLLFAAARRTLARDGEDQWAPAAVARIADSARIVGVDIASIPWTEIDFPADLRLARSAVWPQIKANAPSLVDDRSLAAIA